MTALLSSSISIITSLDFTLNNSFAPTFVVGDDSAPCLEVGRAEIEGTITAYFEDDALINRFLNETETELSVSVDDPTNRFLNETETELSVSVDDPTGSNAYTFLFPRIKINSAPVPVDGANSRVINMSFVSLYDSTEETNLKITRS